MTSSITLNILLFRSIVTGLLVVGVSLPTSAIAQLLKNDTPPTDIITESIEKDSSYDVIETSVMSDFGLDTIGSPMQTGPTVSGASAPQQVTFDGNAINVVLPAGIERKITFPYPIAELKIDPMIAPAKLTTTPLGDVVLWKATESFEPTRVLVNDDSGAAYALDLTVVESAVALPALNIALPGESVVVESPRVEEVIPVHIRNRNQYSYRALTQFASQQLYAPERLIRSIPGLQLTEVVREPVHLMRLGEFTATPVASWRAPGLTVTAVKLQNNLNRWVNFDPRQLIGQWLTATAQFTHVAPNGHGADTTVVYLISAEPFETALGSWNLVAVQPVVLPKAAEGHRQVER